MHHIHRVLLLGAFFVCGPSVLQAQTLIWDANSESDIAGYRVHYGTASGNYTTEVDVGNQTQYQPPSGFDWSRTLYFAVRAYNTSGLTSSYSAEVQWTPPVTRVTSLVASVSYPLQAGQRVTWTATATNEMYPVEFRFWLYRKTAWALVQDYSLDNTFTWTPTAADVGEPYRLQVWARAVGTTVSYESWLGTPTFAVISNGLMLSADVDFPTPPGNQVVWTSEIPAGATGQIEYRFMVRTQSSSTWTIFRDYATSNQAQWTPTTVGTYAVQVWARAVGSTVDYEYRGTTDFFEVSQTALSVTSLTADVASPASTGTNITWTARVRGGSSGPIQYQFWLHSPSTGWQLAQPYGSSLTFTWTPTWDDQGDHTVQVWVRNNGSTASYETWRSSAPLTIQRAAMGLTTATLFPVAPGSHVDWTAGVGDPTANLEYEFWLYSTATSSWTLARPYALDPTFRWIPQTTGSYAVRVLGRQPGTSTTYEASSNLVEVSQGPAQIASLTSDVAFPAAPGTTITWTAAASGGYQGPLEYQYWRWSNGSWRRVQDYSTLSSYSWTPTGADVGDHALQVWVRSAGSSAAYEAYKSTGVFSIN